MSDKEINKIMVTSKVSRRGAAYIYNLKGCIKDRDEKIKELRSELRNVKKMASADHHKVRKIRRIMEA